MENHYEIKGGDPIRFINGNQLDHRKSNLTVGYQEVQIVKGNKYEVRDDKAYIKLNRRDGSHFSDSNRFRGFTKSLR